MTTTAGEVEGGEAREAPLHMVFGLSTSKTPAPAREPALASRIASGCKPRCRVGVGLGVEVRGSNVVVCTIKPGGPACVGGVQLGDVLLAVANEGNAPDSNELIWIDVRRFSEAQLLSLMAGMDSLLKLILASVLSSSNISATRISAPRQSLDI